MAVLECLNTGARYPLAARMLVGRSHTCDLRLMGAQVSGVHAELLWDGSRWVVHDLGSRNGTLVDDQPLAPQLRYPLGLGMQLVFGAPDQRFRLVDGTAPGLVAIADDDTMRQARGGMLCLPTDDDPQRTLIERKGVGWELEGADTPTPLHDRQRLEAGGQGWIIHLPAVAQNTEDGSALPLSIERLRLEFLVSRDEEHVQLVIYQDARRVELRPRAHDFFLLTLARGRRSDQAQDGLPEPEHGWVYREDLASSLRVDRTRINLWVHRARRQFADAGVVDVGGLIERRERSEQLRIGVRDLVVSPFERAPSRSRGR